MTQRDRDRLVVLKKAQKKLITQKQAATELDLTERHVRRLLKRLAAEGDKAVIHALRGRASNRKLRDDVRQKALAILSLPEWKGFGPTLASYHLAKDHDVRIGREALRQMMTAAGLWRAKKQKVEDIHPWRPRRSCRGELVQWDTSEHEWLEGRGEKLYLISMIDDASSESLARFVRSDSTEENMRLLMTYLERNGRPVAFYTDKASLFRTAPKVRRDEKALPREQQQEMPPTQIGRALQELQIVWIAAHSPQAKGRVDRRHGVLQDRLVKALRHRRISTLEAANRFLDETFLEPFNEQFQYPAAQPADLHRSVPRGVRLEHVLSFQEQRQVRNDWTISWRNRCLQLTEADQKLALVRQRILVCEHLDGSLHLWFRKRELTWAELPERPQRPKAAKTRVGLLKRRSGLS